MASFTRTGKVHFEPLVSDFEKNVDIEKVRELGNGDYLYDFILNEVIYFIDTKAMVDKEAWLLAPPTYEETKFTHVIAINSEGSVYKIYNTINNFCPALFIAHIINLSFPPGDYSINTSSAKVVFNFYLKQFGYGSVLDRTISTYCTHGFDPTGKPLPSYDLNPEFIEKIYETEDLNEKDKKEEAKKAVNNLFGENMLDIWDSRFNRTYYDYMDDGIICLSDLIGEETYPKVSGTILQPSLANRLPLAR